MDGNHLHRIIMSARVEMVNTKQNLVGQDRAEAPENAGQGFQRDRGKQATTKSKSLNNKVA